MVAPDVAALHATRYTIPMVPDDHPIRERFPHDSTFGDIDVVYILRRTARDGWVIMLPFEQRGCWSETDDRFITHYEVEDSDEYRRRILFPSLDAARWVAERLAAEGLAELEVNWVKKGWIPAPAATG